jgi:tetratricopeptide (TPR) repeat protein
VQCTSCGHDNRDEAKFCEECASALALACSRCGTVVRVGAKFCDVCGTALKGAKGSGVTRIRDAILTPSTLTANTLPLDGERKTITALFADIKGSMELLEDLDPEEARRIVDPALQLMMDAVHRYDGYVAQSTGDGIFALFGAPVAHEDHPQRALYAALRMQDDLKRYAERLRAEKGLTRFWRGELVAAEEHFAAGLAFFEDPGFRQFPGAAVLACGFASWTAWTLGHADVARARIVQAMAAVDRNNAFELAYAETFAANSSILLREYEAAEAVAVQALGRSEKHQFAFLTAASRIALGAARAHRERAGEGVALIQQGIAGLSESAPRAEMSYFVGILAHAQAYAGAIDDALPTVERALQANPDELVWRPENLRLRGTLWLTRGQTELAAADFREAIALAQQMGAKALELRATMSLARLLAEQGRRDEARTMLADIYGWFTEGFDTVDLKEAKALLEELRAPLESAPHSGRTTRRDAVRRPRQKRGSGNA